MTNEVKQKIEETLSRTDAILVEVSGAVDKLETMLTPPAVLSKLDLITESVGDFEKVFVPQLNKDVYVQVLNAQEVGEYRAELLLAQRAETMDARIKIIGSFEHRYVGRCLCDEKGAPMFATNELDILGQCKPKTILALYNAVQKVNPLGLTGEVEEKVKNSEATEDAASSSDSPSN